MALIYAFQEEDRDGLLKIGFAKNHWRERFQDQQPCNPRRLLMVGAFRFVDLQICAALEGRLKKGAIFPHAPGTSLQQEWYTATKQQFLDGRWLPHGVAANVEVVEPLLSRYDDDLNAGDVGDRWKLLLYLFGEEQEAGFCKIHMTAYNWADASSTYLTGNARRPVVRGRWAASDNASLREVRANLFDRFADQALHYGWFALDWRQAAAAIDDEIRCGRLVDFPRDPILDARPNSSKREYRRRAQSSGG